MKRLNYTSLITFTFLVIGFSFSVKGQQPDNETSPSQPEPKLEIALGKNEIIQLEPLPITILLKNESSQTIKSEAVLDFSAGRTSLHVRREGETDFKKANNTRFYKFLYAVEAEMKPGDKVELTQLLEAGLNIMFPQPGTYQVKVGFGTRRLGKRIFSNTLTLQVNAPTGIDKEAYDFIKAKEAFDFYKAKPKPSLFLIGSDLFESEEAKNNLKEFVSTFSNSTYGPYATYHLGLFYHVKKDYLNARNEFSKLSSKMDFFYHNDVTKRLGEIEKNLQNK